MSLRDKLQAVSAKSAKPHTDTQPKAQEPSGTFFEAPAAQEPKPNGEGIAQKLLSIIGVQRQDTYVPSTHRAALSDDLLAAMPPPGTLARKLWARECLIDEQRRELADLQQRGLIR